MSRRPKNANIRVTQYRAAICRNEALLAHAQEQKSLAEYRVKDSDQEGAGYVDVLSQGSKAQLGSLAISDSPFHSLQATAQV